MFAWISENCVWKRELCSLRWEQFNWISWPDKMMMMVSACLPGKENLEIRQAIARWSSLQVGGRSTARAVHNQSHLWTGGRRLVGHLRANAEALPHRAAHGWGEADDGGGVRHVHELRRPSRQMVRTQRLWLHLKFVWFPKFSAGVLRLQNFLYPGECSKKIHNACAYLKWVCPELSTAVVALLFIKNLSVRGRLLYMYVVSKRGSSHRLSIPMRSGTHSTSTGYRGANLMIVWYTYVPSRLLSDAHRQGILKWVTSGI